MSDGKFFMIGFTFLLSASFTLIMTAFTVFHYAYLVNGNRTTLEFCDNSQHASKPNYDEGCSKNWVAVFGSNPLFWFFPFFPNTHYKGLDPTPSVQKADIAPQTNSEDEKKNILS